MKKKSLAISLSMVLSWTFLWPSSHAQIGINGEFVTDWSTQLVFVDVFKHSRSWLTRNVDGSGPWDTGIPVPLDNLGYPLELPYDNGVDPPQAVHTLMTREIGGQYPGGVYTLIFEGQGEVVVDFDAERQVFTSPGSHPVRVHPGDGGIWLVINRSDAADPIRNIRMIMPGFEATYETDPFYPSFLERLAPFQGFRFLNLQHINFGAPIVRWDERKTPDYVTQSPGGSLDPANLEGVAYEYLAAIANRLEGDPWFCIPHRVDDDYITRFARFLRDNIDPAKRIAIEYSNEIWNTIYPQQQWCSDRGVEQGLSNDPYEAGLLYQARRSGQIFDIFEREFGGLSRLRRVIAGQAANVWVSQTVLRGLADPIINPHGFNADDLAIAPYFGGEIADLIGDSGQIETITVNEILDLTASSLPEVRGYMVQNRAEANAYSVGMIAYEGGQHLVATNYAYIENPTLTAKLADANRHPRMGEIYRRYLDSWFRSGGGLFMAYSFVSQYGRFGSWGALEFMDQPIPNAPKYRALIEHAVTREVAPGQAIR